MSFPFRTAKAAEVAAIFLQKSDGYINVMKLVKLIYLLDRKSLLERGVPIVGGIYVSMKNGPLTSQILDLINSGRLNKHDDTTWEDHIEARKNHVVSLKSAIIPTLVSEGEVEMINEIWNEHGSKDQWELRDWCHQNCPEWSDIEGVESIPIQKLAEVLKKSDVQAKRWEIESREQEKLNQIFS